MYLNLPFRQASRPRSSSTITKAVWFALAALRDHSLCLSLVAPSLDLLRSLGPPRANVLCLFSHFLCHPYYIFPSLVLLCLSFPLLPLPPLISRVLRLCFESEMPPYVLNAQYSALNTLMVAVCPEGVGPAPPSPLCFLLL